MEAVLSPLSGPCVPHEAVLSPVDVESGLGFVGVAAILTGQSLRGLHHQSQYVCLYLVMVRLRMTHLKNLR